MEIDDCLIVITGPTGSGKSALAVETARRLGCEIISADSRQIYQEIPIGTAAPAHEELAAVPHHFIGTLPLDRYYSAAQFESDVMAMLPGTMERGGGRTVMCGGSMMYVDAVTRGIDELPTISEATRRQAMEIYERGGLQQLRLTLLELDPTHYREVDLNNHRRLIHAIEICLESGVPCSTLRTGTVKERPFKTIMMAIEMPREMLFERINRRVDAMIGEGFVEEARRVYARRDLNSLNTVGYKEMFAYFDDTMDFETAVARMKKNTRVYAKKQMTWMKSRPEIIGLDATSPTPLIEQAMAAIDRAMDKTDVKGC